MDAREYYEKHAARSDAKPDNSDVAKNEPRPAGLFARRDDDDVAMDFLASLPHFDRFLDVGCGDLRFLERLAGRVRERFGVDISPYQSWNAHPEVGTSVVDLDRAKLPFEDSWFDGVSMLMVLEHVFDPFHAVREISRVLRPGGYFVMNVPNIAYIRHRIRLLFGALPITSSSDSFENGSWDGFHLHNFTLKSLKWLMERHGNFQLERKGGSGLFSRLRSFWPSLLTGDLVLLLRKRT